MTSDSARITVSTDRVAWSRSGDQLIVLDLQSSTYLSLNGSATVLWECLVGGEVQAGELAAALQTEFGIPAETARDDAQEFVDDLLARGFVHRASP